MKKQHPVLRLDTARDDFARVMYRRIFWPAVASSIGQALADMADALLIGQRMGEVGLAAVGVTLPLFMLLNIFMHGFGIGGSVKYARLLGEGKPAEAIESFRHVLFSALCVAAGIALAVNLFPAAALRLLGTTAADGELYMQALVYVRLIAAAAPLFFLQYILNYYLRCDGRAMRASAGFVAGCATDIACNVLFVLLLGLKTLGAGLATVCGALVCILFYLPALRPPKAGGKAQGTLHWQKLRPGRREAWGCFKAGFSTSAQYAYQMIFLLIANHTLMQLFGSTGVAVLDIVQNASYLILYLYDAAAKAQQPLASTFYGEKDRASLRRTLRLSLVYGMTCGALAAGLIALLPQAVCAAFGIDNPAALQAGTPALRLYCFSSPFAGVNVLLESYCQTVEQEKHAFVISTLRGTSACHACAGPACAGSVLVTVPHHRGAFAAAVFAVDAPRRPAVGAVRPRARFQLPHP